MTNKSDPNEAHFARKIDTRLAPPILNMVNEGTDAAIQDDAGTAVRKLLRGLAVRNLLRGYLLSIPTGQAAADAMGVDKLTEAELRKNNTDDIEPGAAERRLPRQHAAVVLHPQGGRDPRRRQLARRARQPHRRRDADRDHAQRPELVPQRPERARGIPPRASSSPNGGGPIVTIRDFFQFADLAA